EHPSAVECVPINTPAPAPTPPAAVPRPHKNAPAGPPSWLLKEVKARPSAPQWLTDAEAEHEAERAFGRIIESQDQPAPEEPTVGEKVGLFQKGVAEGLSIEIAIESGLGFIAGVAGGLVAWGVGLALLGFAIYEGLSHKEEIAATANRLVEGAGTLN